MNPGLTDVVGDTCEAIGDLVFKCVISVGVQRRGLKEVAVVAQLTLVNGAVAMQNRPRASVARELKRPLTDLAAAVQRVEGVQLRMMIAQTRSPPTASSSSRRRRPRVASVRRPRTRSHAASRTGSPSCASRRSPPEARSSAPPPSLQYRGPAASSTPGRCAAPLRATDRRRSAHQTSFATSRWSRSIRCSTSPRSANGAGPSAIERAPSTSSASLALLEGESTADSTIVDHGPACAPRLDGDRLAITAGQRPRIALFDDRRTFGVAEARLHLPREGHPAGDPSDAPGELPRLTTVGLDRHCVGHSDRRPAPCASSSPGRWCPADSAVTPRGDRPAPAKTARLGRRQRARPGRMGRQSEAGTTSRPNRPGRPARPNADRRWLHRRRSADTRLSADRMRQSPSSRHRVRPCCPRCRWSRSIDDLRR